MADKAKPIRLTKARAVALLEVFEVGVFQTRNTLATALRYPDLITAEEMAAYRRVDAQLSDALDAAAIVRARYVDHTHAPVDQAPRLFGEQPAVTSGNSGRKEST